LKSFVKTNASVIIVIDMTDCVVRAFGLMEGSIICWSIETLDNGENVLTIHPGTDIQSTSDTGDLIYAKA
jgi:hypothetical protein